MTACTYTYECNRCGRVTVAGDGWQATAIMVDGSRYPRVYELCTGCTKALASFLEGPQ